MNKPRLLTGDQPTGRLHLGHWVGSLENRVQLQDRYESYFLIANLHAFTTRAERAQEIRAHTLEIALDYLSAGIDPNKSTIFIQSEVPALSELTYLMSMLVSAPRVMRNPTLKDEIRDKDLGDSYPFGFLLYPVGQVADILAFRPAVVPVGEDQIPHLEMAREVARKFNHLYCAVAPGTADEDHSKAGGLFPIFAPLMGRMKRLPGLNGPNDKGHLLKMSKSLDNAIYLSDSADLIRQKVMKMYTDPKRITASTPGTVENNPLWIFHRTFNTDIAWLEDAEAQYRAGTIGDVACKKRLIEILVALTEPMRARRAELAQDTAGLMAHLQVGIERANEVAEETLDRVKSLMHQKYFDRTLTVNAI